MRVVIGRRPGRSASDHSFIFLSVTQQPAAVQSSDLLSYLLASTATPATPAPRIPCAFTPPNRRWRIVTVPLLQTRQHLIAIFERGVAADNCGIYAFSAPLNYWPASTTADKSNLTLSPNATEPQTAIVDGITFTSPTVYLLYDFVYATGGCGTVGAQHTNAVVGLRSEDVSIFRGYHNIDGPERLNFSDFLGPVPFKCNRLPEENCFPIRAVYNPLLVIPEKIRDLDPAWKNCGVDQRYGTNDPPRILVPAQALVRSTSAFDAVITLEAAVPAPSVLSPGAASTMKPHLASPSPTRLPATGLNPQNPPAKDQPARDPPARDPPARDPPARDPPARDPPTQDAHKYPPSKDPNEDPPNVDSDVRSFFINENSIFLKLSPSSVGGLPTTISGEVLSVGVDGIAFGDKTIPFSAFQPVGASARQATSNAAAGPAPGPAIATNFAELFEIVNGHPLHRADVLIPTPSITGFASVYQSVAAASLTPRPVITFGSQHYTADVAGEYIIEGQTLRSGSTITIAGTVISAPAVQAMPSTHNFPAIVIGSKSYTANSAYQYVVAGQTLFAGGSITVSGIVISAPDYPASMRMSRISFPTTVIGSKLFTANSVGQYVIAGQTLFPGGTITVSGTAISAPNSPAPMSFPGAAFPTIVINSQTLTANPAGRYVIAGQTLSPGRIITVSGTVISAPTFLPPSVPISTALVLGSQPLTANPAGQYLISGQTLIPGGTVRLSGQPVISLAPSATALIIGSVTEALVFPTRGFDWQQPNPVQVE
ncbi:hypothetical protein MMC29_001329 [Sticta canariensis]|nr:hypothetical protein [Sticta canariensis]